MYCYITQLARRLVRERDLREVATHLNASSFPEAENAFSLQKLSCFNMAEDVCEKKHLW